MTTGTVKWFNYTKGYGFVALDDGQRDVFLHVSEVEKAGIQNLNEGQKIQFKIETNGDKKSATDISLV